MYTPNYYQCTRKEMRQLLPKSYSKVLEIGCGEGNFRNNLRLKNEYWGVELVEAVAEIAKTKLDHVLVGSYQEKTNEIPDNYFDLVVCNDVIEHMADHDYFFKSIKQKISHNGFLVFSIPNVRYHKNLYNLIVNKDWKYEDIGILDNTHLRFFTKKSILRTVDHHGFTIEDCIGINDYWFKKFWERCVYFVARTTLGEDIKYLQFGIRLKKS